ncbi:discoidin domain-containing protein [Arthrobacter sp. HMWF013]|uniref:discoidin domain-containing protein n=1 Tax=Arthrobacter sp. HMWF013 TaxID=2056849 RepID=UPI000D359189|nr:discoidin domain-containing protein [Arthrobacter sp. HMWF013]PTT67104.1 mycodextranase [Arthrobacter sp. HMWF013]
MTWNMRKAVPAALLTALLAAGTAQTGVQPALAQGKGQTSQEGVQGAGANVPFMEYQAEGAATNGTVIGPDRAYGTIAAESVGRSAVRLEGSGQFVEFTLEKAANALNLRYSIPDSADGHGLDATLGVHINGKPTTSLTLTSRYSWFYGQFPWTNNPADGGRRHMYDDSRIMFGSTLPAGTKVRLQVGEADNAPWYVIDVADFENVAGPSAAPENSLSVLDYGADPTGKRDSSDAIQAAIDAASGTGRTLWIPEGTFTVTRHLIVDNVTVKGAGPWYSMLHGDGVGVYGKYAPTPSANVHLSDFAIFGEVKNRDDNAALNAIGGALADSTVDNIWMQHTKVGVWVTGPFTNLQMSRLRILDQTADGVNFHQGVTNSSVTDSYIRNTGDDGLAMWSQNHADVNNTFSRNTVKVPVLANNIAIYGGSDIKVTKNLVTDTLTQGGGIQIANRFGAVPLAGTTTVEGNELLRTGSLDLFSHIGNGALWFWAGDGAMSGTVNVRNNTITDSSYEAIHFYGNPITGVTFDNNTINKTGTFAFQLNTSGAAIVRGTTATGLGATGIYDCNSGFTLTDEKKNAGWSETSCGYPAPGPLKLSAVNLEFSRQVLGTTSEPQIVTITNDGTTAQPIASITATGTFNITDTCGTELAAGDSCTASVSFAPTKGGEKSGALTISDGSPAGRYQSYLKGLPQGTDGNLAAYRPATATSENSCCTAGGATDSNPDTYWESASNAFPQSLSVDLEEAVQVSRAVLKTNSAWGGRTQTFELLASNDGVTYTTIIPSADYVFEPALNNNAVSIDLPANTQYRFLQVTVTGNTGWPAAQIAEFEAY